MIRLFVRIVLRLGLCGLGVLARVMRGLVGKEFCSFMMICLGCLVVTLLWVRCVDWALEFGWCCGAELPQIG